MLTALTLSMGIGENAELLVDLNSEYRDRRKDAVKRVIANMTVGKDVSSLFPQVVKNMQTEDLEMVHGIPQFHQLHQGQDKEQLHHLGVAKGLTPISGLFFFCTSSRRSSCTCTL